MEQKYCISCDEPVIDKIPACPLQCRSQKCKAYQRRPPIDTSVKPVVWVMGGPGSGKQRQCEKIVQIYEFCHLCIGDLLRKEIMAGTNRSKCLNSIMQRGGLVPNDVVLALLKEAMEAAPPDATGFLIDGYPREKSQGVLFEKTIGPVACILYFEASRETLAERLETRAQTSDHKDQDMCRFKMRLQTFLQYNPGVLEAYKDRVVRIDVEQDSNKIFCDIQRILDPVVMRARETGDRKAREAAAAAELEAIRNAEILEKATLKRDPLPAESMSPISTISSPTKSSSPKSSAKSSAKSPVSSPK